MRICFVGDSFVNGTGDPECLGWAGRVCRTACQQGHDLTAYNLGVRRDTSDDIRARWRSEVDCRSSQGEDNRLVFAFGTNDTTAVAGQLRVPPDRSVQNAEAILIQAQETHPVLMISPAPVANDALQNDRTLRLAARYQALCDRLTIPYLDVFTPLLNSPVWMTEAAQFDGAHPRAKGYQVYADLVEQWSAWRSWFAP
ncbi:MAG: GDSL-type esterase/lipase family protein [Synechococcales bacterium]|nr:GDSL-type esterase/lipase family protein [Synechococcales bacterium]